MTILRTVLTEARQAGVSREEAIKLLRSAGSKDSLSRLGKIRYGGTNLLVHRMGFRILEEVYCGKQ